MREIDSTDYHDFVIKDGRLIGEFEQMYQKSSEIPWHQDDALTRLDCHLAATMMARHGPYDSVLEIGTGLGFFADFLTQRISCNHFLGTDISPTAMHEAQRRFPRLHFKTFNVGETMAAAMAAQKFDLVLLRAVMWYLVPTLPVVVENLTKLVRPGGKLFISQNFPPLDKNFVGKDVLPNPTALVELFEPGFKILSVCEFSDREREGGNDNWTMFVGERR